MTINVPISLDLTGIEALLGKIGKQPNVTDVVDPIVNDVTVAIADPNATTTLSGVNSSDSDSITVYGQSGRQFVTILANTTEAGRLAEYLVRPVPEYWFSSIEVLLNAIPAGRRDAVAELEIGQQIRVSKRFPNVTNPVVQDLFVEGIEHEVGVDRHVVRLYCSPASLYRCFVLNLSDLDNPDYGLAGAGAACSVNGFSLSGQDALNVITVNGDLYWVADWRASGSLTFNQPTSVEYLILGGGGGASGSGGGGGAGGLRLGTTTASATTHTITVGAGSSGMTYAATNRTLSAGGNSSAFGLTANGGGGGGELSAWGGNGGSGGGAGIAANQNGGGSGTAGQGNNGGINSSASLYGGGGGGGAGGPGGSGSTTSGGAGGIGVSSSITGTAVVYATGGKSNVWNAGPLIGRNGTDGLGEGGEGVRQTGASPRGGDGGDGRVIVRWKVYA